MHIIIFGILLGLGAAIPIGPVNLEIIRRNLAFGTPSGLALGLGACVADLTYIILLFLGALTLLQHPDILRVVAILGSLVLGWFGISILRAKEISEKQAKALQASVTSHGIQGYLMTLVNPYTILFWASVSAQLSVVANQESTGMVFAAIGVMLGTVGWVLSLNGILHFTRHRLSARMIRWLNYFGGVVLLGFAVFGLWRNL